MPDKRQRDGGGGGLVGGGGDRDQSPESLKGLVTRGESGGEDLENSKNSTARGSSCDPY